MNKSLACLLLGMLAGCAQPISTAKTLDSGNTRKLAGGMRNKVETSATAPITHTSVTRPAGEVSSDDIKRFQQFEMETPDISGPLSMNLKVCAEADTWDELVAKAKPTLTWGQPDDAPPDCGFPNMMWIDESAGGKTVFRLAAARTWKPTGQKERWVLLDLAPAGARQHQDDLLRQQIQGRPMPASVDVAKKKPTGDHPSNYAIVRGTNPRGGTVYEIGWAKEMCDGTGHDEPLCLLYVWRDGAGKWRFIGEGPEEIHGANGAMECEAVSCDATVRWVGQPPRPTISFAVKYWTSEVGEGQIGLPDLTICHDALLDVSVGPLPATVTHSRRQYIIAEKSDTLEKIVYRLVVRGNQWNAYRDKLDKELLRKRQEIRRQKRDELLKLNPQLPKSDSTAIPEGTRILID